MSSVHSISSSSSFIIFNTACDLNNFTLSDDGLVLTNTTCRDERFIGNWRHIYAASWALISTAFKNLFPTVRICSFNVLFPAFTSCFACCRSKSMPRWIFSSPEPKAQVSYCHSAPSTARKLSHFQLLQKRLMDFDETWYAWSTHGSLEVLLFFPGRGKNRSRGSPSSRNVFFRPVGYSDKPNAKQWPRIMWEEVLLFLFQSEVKFLTRFWRLFGLCHFALFFYGVLCSKVFNLHLFCVISMFVSEENAYIKD